MDFMKRRIESSMWNTCILSLLVRMAVISAESISPSGTEPLLGLGEFVYVGVDTLPAFLT